MSTYNKKIGHWGEKLAAKHLAKQNYVIIERGWKKREGEIDIIAYDSKTGHLVFIEVKTRTTNSFGPVEESISQLKRKRLEAIISRYIAEIEYRGDYRLDVILIKKGCKIAINHLENVRLT